MKSVAPGVHGRNFKRKTGGFRGFIDGDVRVGAPSAEDAVGRARARMCA